MKISNLLLSLSFAGICFSQAAAQVPYTQTSASPAARHIGDGVRSIGDTNRYVDTTEDVRPAEFVPDEDVQLVSPASAMDLNILAPTARRSSGNRLVSSSSGRWLTAESLLWFSEQQSSPALVTTSASQVLPVAGNAGVTSAFGGADGIDRGVIPGYRLSGGMFLDSEEKIGVGGRVTGIFSSVEKFAAASDGSTSIGIPYYNLQSQANDAFLVAYRSPSQLVSDGSVEARSDLDMLTAEGSLYLLLGRSKNHRADLLAGYTFNRLQNSIGLMSTSTNRAAGDGIPDGTIFRTSDLFDTENAFHGAHLGVLSSLTANRISLQTLAKVSFGNMRTSSTVSGSLSEELVGPPTVTPGGIFTQTSNIGSMTQDSFAFIPEMGLKLGYAVNDNVNVSVGYTFMFWSTVGLAGDQIDPTIDFIGGGGRPAPMFNEGTFWMQGLDFGLTIDL